MSLIPTDKTLDSLPSRNLEDMGGVSVNRMDWFPCNCRTFKGLYRII